MTFLIILIVFEQITAAYQFNLSAGRRETDRHQPRNAHLRYIRNGDCRNEIIHLMDGLAKNSPWAVRMHRSFSGYPSGLMHGNNYQLGDYDECLSAHSPDEFVQGKYCIVDVHASLGHTFTDDFDLNHNPYNSYRDKFRVAGDPSRKPRNTIHVGVCIPRSCSPDDISTLGGFIRDMADSFGYNTTVKLMPNSCTDPKTNKTGEKVVWGVILTLSNLVLISTVWDIFAVKGRNKLVTILRCFSLKKNLNKLMTPTESNEFDAFHGMKTLSMILIILGHRCLVSFGGPVFNADFLEEGYRSFPTIFLLNGILIVDTFFLIGGFLTFITLRQACKQRTGVSTLTVCLNRWLRITPGYMLTVFFYGYALENLGSGPLWSAKVGREAERCRLNWWTNFLCVNNYIRADKLCMFQSWYVSCDMHYTLISPAIVSVVTKTGKRGLLILVGAIAAFSFIVSTITYLNKYDGIMRIYHGVFEDLAGHPFFSQMYIKSHNRIIPYLSGMTAAYIYLQLKESDIKLTGVTLWMSSVAAIVLALISICGAWIFYIPGRKYSALENALYASLHRVLWSVSMGWTAVATTRKSFGKIQPILTSRAFLPFSRLSFGTFLVHGAVQLYTTASLREPDYMSYPKLFWMTSGDIVVSFFFAFILFLLVEAPVKGMQQILFNKKFLGREGVETVCK